MKTKDKANTQRLDANIASLEAQKQQDFLNLKLQFHKTSDHFTPINVLNRTIQDFKESPETKINVFDINKK